LNLADVLRSLGVSKAMNTGERSQLIFSAGADLSARLASIRGPFGAGSSRVAMLLISLGVGTMVIALSITIASLGVITTFVTGGVFFLPLVLGGSAAVNALVRLERECHIAGDRATSSRIMASERIPIDSDSLRRFEPTEQEVDTISARVVKRVALACTDGRYEPVASVLALDLPAIRSGSIKIRKSQLFAIRLGILTTFIGLMIGLYDIVPLLRDVNTSNKTQAINTLVQEMATAFGGSVAGLFAATLLQIITGITEKREGDLLSAVETAILAVQTYFYNATRKEPLIRSMDALGTEINSFRRSLDEGRVEIDRAARHVAMEIRGQDDILRERQEELSRGRDAFADLVSSQTQAISTLEDGLRRASERIAADFRGWLDAEVQATSARLVASGLAEGKTALAEHAKAIETALLATGKVMSHDLLEQATQTLARTENAQRRTRELLVIVFVAIATIALGQLALLIWLVVH
jgi:hypothetical protein